MRGGACTRSWLNGIRSYSTHQHISNLKGSCPYQLLGVERQASAQDIKKAFKQKALLLHPDLSSGTVSQPSAFIQLVTAYELLSDGRARAEYDAAQATPQAQAGTDVQAKAAPAGVPKSSRHVPEEHLAQWRYGVGSWLARTRSEARLLDPLQVDDDEAPAQLVRRLLKRYRHDLNLDLANALQHAYLGPRLSLGQRAPLPPCFEAEHRSEPYTDNDLLQLVSGRTLLGRVSFSQPHAITLQPAEAKATDKEQLQHEHTTHVHVIAPYSTKHDSRRSQPLEPESGEASWKNKQQHDGEIVRTRSTQDRLSGQQDQQLQAWVRQQLSQQQQQQQVVVRRGGTSDPGIARHDLAMLQQSQRMAAALQGLMPLSALSGHLEVGAAKEQAWSACEAGMPGLHSTGQSAGLPWPSNSLVPLLTNHTALGQTSDPADHAAPNQPAQPHTAHVTPAHATQHQEHTQRASSYSPSAAVFHPAPPVVIGQTQLSTTLQAGALAVAGEAAEQLGRHRTYEQLKAKQEAGRYLTQGERMVMEELETERAYEQWMAAKHRYQPPVDAAGAPLGALGGGRAKRARNVQVVFNSPTAEHRAGDGTAPPPSPAPQEPSQAQEPLKPSLPEQLTEHLRDAEHGHVAASMRRVWFDADTNPSPVQADGTGQAATTAATTIEPAQPHPPSPLPAQDQSQDSSLGKLALGEHSTGSTWGKVWSSFAADSALQPHSFKGPQSWPFSADTPGSTTLYLTLTSEPGCATWAVREPAVPYCSCSRGTPANQTVQQTSIVARSASLVSPQLPCTSSGCVCGGPLLPEGRLKVFRAGELIAGVQGDWVFDASGVLVARVVRGGSLGVHLLHVFDYRSSTVRLLCRAQRAVLLPSSMWLFPPRSRAHSHGGWAVEWVGFRAALSGSQGWVHPCVYVFIMAYATVDLERAWGGDTAPVNLQTGWGAWSKRMWARLCVMCGFWPSA